MLGQRWQHNIIGANTGASHYRLLLSSAPALEGSNIDIDIQYCIKELKERDRFLQIQVEAATCEVLSFVY